MKKSISFGVILSVAALASPADDAFTQWVHSGKVYGNVKYYYIDTEKQLSGDYVTSHANSVGGQLSYTTGSWRGIDAGVTFMTTQPFALPHAVDTSIIGKDNGTHGRNASKAFSVLGQSYLNYTQNDYQFWAGRQTAKTPLINAKEVRMLPSAVQGAEGRVFLDHGLTLYAGYYNGFKQRTSSRFENIVKHALGDLTQTITGDDEGYVVPVALTWENRHVLARVYDYYAPDFMNSVYADFRYKSALDTTLSYSLAVQAIVQDSVGKADDNLAEAGSVTGGKAIRSRAVAAQASIVVERSKFAVAYSHVAGDSDYHDALVLPWDGTPLYTNMITSNNLFQSLYGNALKADTAYIGGTDGIKFSYAQNFDFTGFRGFSGTVSAAQFDNADFDEVQNDYNAVVAYHTNVFSLSLKGIWVFNNSGAAADGSVSQNPVLRQYRVIANYKF